MGKVVTGILVVLHMHGLSANQGLEKLQPITGLTAKQGFKDLLNPTALENDIQMKMEKFVPRGIPWGFPIQPDWVVKNIQDKYNDLENNLVKTEKSKRVF